MLGGIVLLTCMGCASTSNHSSAPGSNSNAMAPKSLNGQLAKLGNTGENTGIGVFSPTYQSEDEDKYYDALEIYESSQPVPSGIYDYQGLVFVVVVIDTKKESIQYLEGTALLRVKAFLQRGYPSLPTNFNIYNKVVEKELDDDTGIYRYAVVFRQSDITRLIERKDKHH